MVMATEVYVGAIIYQSPSLVRTSFGARPHFMPRVAQFSHLEAQWAE
jgi:hypothetical protein